jgi:homeobox protein cut-like
MRLVAELQEASMQHGRKLAESSKEFKRNHKAVNETVGPLMKQYQEEINGPSTARLRSLTCTL